MRVRSSNNNVKGLVCLDPLRNIYRLRWDFSNGSYEEVELKYKPSKEDIQSIIEDYYNNIFTILSIKFVFFARSSGLYSMRIFPVRNGTVSFGFSFSSWVQKQANNRGSPKNQNWVILSRVSRIDFSSF